jgi:hypothetical protein
VETNQICLDIEDGFEDRSYVLNGSNYVVWAPDMETLLKSKGLWKYMKTVIPDPTDDQEKFVVDGKKDEVVGVIMTYISWEI